MLLTFNNNNNAVKKTWRIIKDRNSWQVNHNSNQSPSFSPFVYFLFFTCNWNINLHNVLQWLYKAIHFPYSKNLKHLHPPLKKKSLKFYSCKSITSIIFVHAVSEVCRREHGCERCVRKKKWNRKLCMGTYTAFFILLQYKFHSYKWMKNKFYKYHYEIQLFQNAINISSDIYASVWNHS